MPKDEWVQFPPGMTFEPFQIIFPGKQVVEWNETMDWISCFKKDYILVKREEWGHHTNVYIGEIDSPNTPLLKYGLYNAVPRACVIRGWLLSECFFISPEPRPSFFCSTIKYERDKPDTYYNANLTLPGTWVRHIIIDNSGYYFALYDYEDDCTLVMDTNFKILWTCRSIYYPVSLELKEGTLILKRKSRWEDEVTTNEISLNLI